MINLSSVKTEWVAFLLVWLAVVSNKRLELGLELDDIITLASMAGLYTFGRSAVKLRGLA